MESLTAINKSRIRQAFQKALNDYDRHALIQQKMTINLMAHLQDYLPDMRFRNVECLAAKTDFSGLLVI